jgi:flavin-binding protein dodecin
LYQVSEGPPKTQVPHREPQRQGAGRSQAPSRGWKDVSLNQEVRMSVAKITEISSTSTKSFEDAIQQGIARASQTIRNIRSAWIKEQQLRLENNRVAEYQVNMLVTFVLEDE